MQRFPELLAYGTGETDAVDRVDGFDHPGDCAQTTSDVCLCLFEGGGDSVSELEEEGFALLGAFALVGEGQRLVCAAGEFDEIELAFVFERGAEIPALIRREAAILEFNAVEFDAKDEASGGGEFGADGLRDFEDDAGAVGEAAAVFVSAFVGGVGEKLGQEVAVGAVEFDAVVAGFVKEFGRVGEASDEIVDFFLGGRVGVSRIACP